MIWNHRFGVNRRDFLKNITAGAIGGSALMNQTSIAQNAIALPDLNEIDPNSANRSASEPAGERTRQMADWVAQVSYDDIPPRVIEKAKYQLLNTIAAIHAGYKYDPSRSLAELVRGWRGRGESTIIPLGDRTVAHDAVFANATLSMCYDFDDYLFMGHTSHSSVLASLALSEAMNLTFREVLLAQVVGNEVSGRTGASILFGKTNGQLWSSIHCIGAACVGAKLLGLNNARTEHAIGLAMYQPPFCQFPGFMAPDSKLLTAATPTATGLLAAQLAQRGFTGSSSVLTHRQGFVSNFACLPMPFMLSGWGRTWVTDTLAYKIYPGDAYIDTTIDALNQIFDAYARDHGTRIIPPELIRSVEVDANIFSVATEQLAREYTDWDNLRHINVNFTMLINIAIAILAGRLTTEELTTNYLTENRTRIRALTEKITLRHSLLESLNMFQTIGQTIDLGRVFSQFTLAEFLKGIACLVDFYRFDSSLTQAIDALVQFLRSFIHGSTAGTFNLGDYDLERLRIPFGARVKVRLQNGRLYQAMQRIPHGAPGSESQEETYERVRNKFRFEASALLSSQQIEEAIDAVRRLESIDDVRTFLDLVTV